MKKYEALLIIKPTLSEEERENLFTQVQEAVTKNSGSVLSAAVWAEKKKFYFPIKKFTEGLYYLLNFSAEPLSIKDIKHTYNLNEGILRVLITRQD
jgi:small subunit ribosomal protein S6